MILSNLTLADLQAEADRLVAESCDYDRLTEACQAIMLQLAMILREIGYREIAA